MKKQKRPIRYKHKLPAGMFIVQTDTLKTFKAGTLLEFNYGRKQKVGEVGGWKNDPRPSLLVFLDDGDNYIEGINLNYLSEYYVRKLKIVLRKFPGIDGDDLYKILKRTASHALKKGYRKYVRSSMKKTSKLEYGEQIRNALGQFTNEFKKLED